MTIEQIFHLFDKIGCCTFATIDGDYPETRIAHFLTHDSEGIYFMTSKVKPFYRQLKETGKVSVCGLHAKSEVATTEKGDLVFDAGYFIRLSGDVKEVSMEEIQKKNDSSFAYCIEDQKRYPAMTTFVVYRAKGEVYDYDFDKIHRDHKLERERFTFGDLPVIPAGLSITNRCVGCGRCSKVCSFDAIIKDGNRYRINGRRCDECGNCFTVCPAHAIVSKGAKEL